MFVQCKNVLPGIQRYRVMHGTENVLLSLQLPSYVRLILVYVKYVLQHEYIALCFKKTYFRDSGIRVRAAQRAPDDSKIAKKGKTMQRILLVVVMEVLPILPKI